MRLVIQPSEGDAVSKVDQGIVASAFSACPLNLKQPGPSNDLRGHIQGGKSSLIDFLMIGVVNSTD